MIFVGVIVHLHPQQQKRLVGVHCIEAVDRKVGSLFGCAQRLLGDGLIEKLQRRYGSGIKEAYKRNSNGNVIT